MRIPANLATPGLDLCPACKNLVLVHDGRWLDIWTSGPYYTDPEGTAEHDALSLFADGA